MSAESSAEGIVETIYDERLVQVIDAWETIDEAVRSRIIELVEGANLRTNELG